jgi:hypothetical protein
MQQSSTRHPSFNTARIGFNYTGIGKSARQLPFALSLLCSPIQAFSSKRIISNFALIPGGEHGTIFDWLPHAQHRSDFDEN